MQKYKILIATANPGKLQTVRRMAAEYDLTISSPKDFGLEFDVKENGTTFAQNAALKVAACAQALNDPEVFILGDDSGIEISALHNQPGVYTRRWAGHEMGDQEIIDYCLEQMKPFAPAERTATFKTVVALGFRGQEPVFFEGELMGHILEQPATNEITPGLPFGNIFQIDEIDTPLYKLYHLGPKERGGFMSHRERAFHKAFKYIKNAAQ